MSLTPSGRPVAGMRPAALAGETVRRHRRHHQPLAHRRRRSHRRARAHTVRTVNVNLNRTTTPPRPLGGSDRNTVHRSQCSNVVVSVRVVRARIAYYFLVVICLPTSCRCTFDVSRWTSRTQFGCAVNHRCSADKCSAINHRWNSRRFPPLRL